MYHFFGKSCQRSSCPPRDRRKYCAQQCLILRFNQAAQRPDDVRLSVPSSPSLDGSSSQSTRFTGLCFQKFFAWFYRSRRILIYPAPRMRTLPRLTETISFAIIDILDKVLWTALYTGEPPQDTKICKDEHQHLVDSQMFTQQKVGVK